MQQHKRTDRRRPPARTGVRDAPRPRIRTARAGDDANRRGDIVRAAARLFREKGFDATTVRDIAKAVGMRSGSPFYHFETKQDILLAVVEEGLAAGLEATEGVLAERLPPREKFHALVRSHLEILLDEGNDFIPVLLYDWRSLTRENRAKIVALKDRYDAVWQQVVRELKRAGLLHTDSPLARLLVLGAINFMATWYRRDGALGLDALADQTVDFFLGSAKR